MSELSFPVNSVLDPNPLGSAIIYLKHVDPDKHPDFPVINPKYGNSFKKFIQKVTRVVENKLTQSLENVPGTYTIPVKVLNLF